MEFTEKYTKKYVKGSTVVEMSYLIPFCLILFFLLITYYFLLSMIRTNFKRSGSGNGCDRS